MLALAISASVRVCVIRRKITLLWTCLLVYLCSLSLQSRINQLHLQNSGRQSWYQHDALWVCSAVKAVAVSEQKALFSLIEIHWLQLDINRGFGVTRELLCVVHVCCLWIFSTPFIILLGWFLLSYTVLPCSFCHYAPSAVTCKLYSQSIDLKLFPAEVLMSSAPTRGSSQRWAAVSHSTATVKLLHFH